MGMFNAQEAAKEEMAAAALETASELINDPTSKVCTL